MDKERKAAQSILVHSELVAQFAASYFLFSFLILLPENKLFQVYFNIQISRLDPNFQSPRCFKKKKISWSHVKYPVKVLIFLPYLLRYLNKTQRGVWSHTDTNNENLWGNLQLLIQEALAPLHFLEPVGLFCKAGPCRLCPGATARGDGGRSSSSLLWAGEGVQLFQQLSCVVGYCLALLKLVTHPLSAHP